MKIQVLRIGARDPLRNGEEHEEDECSNNSESVSPTETLYQSIDQQRGNCAAHAEAKICDAHRSPTFQTEPVGD